MTKADLQRIRALRDKKTREAVGCFVVEGEKVVSELLAAGFAFDEVYATEPEKFRRTAHTAVATRFVEVSPDEMTRMSHFPTPSSVLAIGPIRRETLHPAELSRGLTLALDGVQDPGNVGTLIRIADWYGCTRVLLSPDCADVFHQKVINASMGSFARVVTHQLELATAFAALRETVAADRVPIVGCDLAGRSVHTAGPLPEAIIVIGSEGRGLRPEVKAAVTFFVTIPRFGGAESLNAAAAAAVVCDNLRRPRLA